MEGGAAGAFMLDVGISSSHAIARFWGITDDAPKVRAADAEPRPASSERLPARTATAVPPPRRMEVIGRKRPAPATGVQGIIEDALRSAGLMK